MTIPGGITSFDYEWERPAGDVVCMEVTARVEEYHPASRFQPPHGGEVEILYVTMPSGQSLEVIPHGLRELLEERAQEVHRSNN